MAVKTEREGNCYIVDVYINKIITNNNYHSMRNEKLNSTIIKNDFVKKIHHTAVVS